MCSNRRTYADEAEAAERVIQLIISGGGTKPPDTMELRRPGELRRVSQETVAERMGIRQATLARMEKGNDPHLSTLKRYAEAPGGRLEVRVRFPEHTIVVAERGPGADSE